MFARSTANAVKRYDRAGTNRDIDAAFPATQCSDLETLPSSNVSAAKKPQLTSPPKACKIRLSGPQPTNTSSSAALGSVTPEQDAIANYLLAVERAGVPFKAPVGPLGTVQERFTPSLGEENTPCSLAAQWVDLSIPSIPESGISQKSSDPRKNPGSVASYAFDAMELIKSFEGASNDEIYSPAPAPAALVPTENIKSMIEFIQEQYSKPIQMSGKIPDQENAESVWGSAPTILRRSTASPEFSDDVDDGDKELEDEFGLKSIKETVNDAIGQLKGLKTQNAKDPATIKLRRLIKTTIVKELLDWIPSIHLFALDAEVTDNIENAHKCLVYAAKTIKRLDKIGCNYEQEDLEYGITVRLRSKKGKVIKEWRDVVGYQSYEILVWIWRDLCLLILRNDSPKEESGEVFVVRFFEDIKKFVPLETYDFRAKKSILSVWDLFLAGGSSSTTRKGTLLRSKALDPTYWSRPMIKAKKQLDHLYRVNRLNELRDHPSVDLYRMVKCIFPDQYKNEPLETVRSGGKPSTIEAQIDIFVFEHEITCLEKMIRDNALQRSSKRFRDISIAFSCLEGKEGVVGWAKKQMLIGVTEEVGRLSREILEEFPSLYLTLEKLGKIGWGTGHVPNVEWFLQSSREGYTDNRHDGDVPIADYRYIFTAYLETCLNWSGGYPNAQCEDLLREMKKIFMSKLGIIFEQNSWVGKALQKGCKTHRVRNLEAALEYFLGSYGFEKILEFEPTAKPRETKKAPAAIERKVSGEKRKYTKSFSKGVVIAQARCVKLLDKIAEDDED